MSNAHSVHIPVMGIAYTIDTPLKVAPYGLDSVISLVDDILLERMRKMYCNEYDIPYDDILETEDDFRALRIPAYLNLIDLLVQRKFENIKASAFGDAREVFKYISLLKDGKNLKLEFQNILDEKAIPDIVNSWLTENLCKGSIDVNIMTKVDKTNYKGEEKLPAMFNDAHAALRGYAMSTLESSVILSAGINPRLYSYIQEFEDFYPNEQGVIKEKIILKVSDYRSAFVQGRFLAKKGLWVSEYRVESGLNCGGHAFATNGLLLGPALDDFNSKREELTRSMNEDLLASLRQKNRAIPEVPMALRVAAQGGVGTSQEHSF